MKDTDCVFKGLYLTLIVVDAPDGLLKTRIERSKDAQRIATSKDELSFC